MFKFRDKKQLAGTLLGSVCFLPSFVVAWMIGIVSNIIIGIITMLISQFLWLTAISLCTWSLENENRKLKDKLNNKSE
jgi:cobalamin biosynthesis protein CobD/CbiB